MAQTPVTLQPGAPIERSLGPGQVHEYTVNAKANSLVKLVVEQTGIDVVVKILTPDGKGLAEYDTPNGDQGSEPVSFVAKEAGKYLVEISGFKSDEPHTGTYAIKLIEVREATEEEIEISKNREEAKAKGIALLLELRDAISQIKSSNTRINAQLKAANLLRNNDEKAASKYLSDAVAELKELLDAANSDDDIEESMSQFGTLSHLRSDVIRILAETDPDAALSFLRSTTPRYSPYGNQSDLVNLESTLELSIADQIGRKDPNRALQIAKQNLKKSYSPALLSTASQLAEKNPEMASELVRDIASKILGEEKLISKVEAANMAIALSAYYGASDKQVDPILKDQNPRISLVQGLHKGLLSEQDFKQLVQKMVREVLSFGPVNGRAVAIGDGLWTVMGGLKSLGPELDKVVSGSSAALDKKQSELVGNVNMHWVNQFQEYQNVISNNPTEAALEAIDKSPAEFREQLYIMLATKEANSGDLNRAKQIINDNVSNPYQRSQALKSFEQQELDHAMSSGKIEEALRNIGAMRTPSERAEQLTQLAGQIGSSRQRATALSLLEQARGLLPPSAQAQDQTQMDALLEIARAFSPYDSKRSFEIIDPLVDQFNDLCTAAYTLKGFGSEFFDDDELDMEGEGVLAQVAGELSEVLGSMAMVNFDRAKATSDKLRLPEVRLHVDLQIAEQTITGKQQ
jgi:hypothetical protein